MSATTHDNSSSHQCSHEVSRFSGVSHIHKVSRFSEVLCFHGVSRPSEFTHLHEVSRFSEVSCYSRGLTPQWSLPFFTMDGPFPLSILDEPFPLFILGEPFPLFTIYARWTIPVIHPIDAIWLAKQRIALTTKVCSSQPNLNKPMS